MSDNLPNLNLVRILASTKRGAYVFLPLNLLTNPQTANAAQRDQSAAEEKKSSWFRRSRYIAGWLEGGHCYRSTIDH